MGTVRHLVFERTIVVQAPAERVLAAFFDPLDLSEWWQVIRSVTVPRPLGTYALEWATTEVRDPILGRLGGAFHGTVMEYRPGVECFVADVFWSPPDGDPIGPMALEVTLSAITSSEGVALPAAEIATEIRVLQSGFEDSGRWQRYYELVGTGWERALASLKMLLEK